MCGRGQENVSHCLLHLPICTYILHGGWEYSFSVTLPFGVTVLTCSRACLQKIPSDSHLRWGRHWRWTETEVVSGLENENWKLNQVVWLWHGFWRHSHGWFWWNVLSRISLIHPCLSCPVRNPLYNWAAICYICSLWRWCEHKAPGQLWGLPCVFVCL